MKIKLSIIIIIIIIDLKNDSAKLALEKKLSELLAITNDLKVRVQTKLKILSLYIHSQIMFEIKLYDFPATWTEFRRALHQTHAGLAWNACERVCERDRMPP